ncbi:MAG: type II secretion system protein [bacterium]|nr:type II secretion system protein [bacterium]
MKKGHTLIETLVSIAVMGIVILVIVSFFSEGIKDWMKTIKKPVVKAQGIGREVMSGQVGDKRGGMTRELRSLIALCNAEKGTITFVIGNGERCTDINWNGLFSSNEAIIFDEDKNFNYEQGIDTVIYGFTPSEGTPIFNFNPDEKHTDEGANKYKFDSGESVIKDANDNNQYDSGETVLSGSSPVNGTKVIPFGKTITYFLDTANREIKRVENDTQIKTIGKDILVDAENNSFGLEFRYFGSGTTGGDELTSLPLTLTDRQSVSFIEIRVTTDVDNDKKGDFALKTKVFPRKFGL